MNKKALQVVKIVAVFLSILTFFIAIVERTQPFEDFFLHVDLLQSVADNLSSSYNPDVQRIYTPQDAVWPYLLELIYKYSNVGILKNRVPQFVGRYVAVSSSEELVGTSTIAEWTAPTTPIFISYTVYDNKEAPLPENIVIVGTIGDLNDWIKQDKDDFNFLINNKLIGALALIFSAVLTFS